MGKYFGFMKCKDFDKSLFQKIKKDLIGKQLSASFSLIENNISSYTIELAKKNVKRANVLLT
jgi:23S rRNA G2445 N2-methylase RlmL